MAERARSSAAAAAATAAAASPGSSSSADPTGAEAAPETPPRWTHAVFYGLLAVGFAAAAYRVSTLPLTAWDESREVMGAFEMAMRGDWIARTYMGELDHWALKPPLHQWSLAILFKLLGYSELVARLPSLLFGAATAILIYHFLDHVTRDRVAAGTAALGLVTALGYYGFHALTAADVDATLVFFTTLAFVATCKVAFEDRRRWWLALGAAIGCAVMTKSVVGLLPAGFALAAFPLARRWRSLASLHLLLGVAIACAIVLPWLLARELRYDDDYLRLLWEVDVAKRSREVIEGHPGDVWFYYDFAVQHLGKWVYLAFASVVLLIDIAIALPPGARRDLVRSLPYRVAAYALLTVALYYAAFSWSASKLKWYLLPGYAVLFILCGVGLALARRRLQRGVVIAVAVLLLAANLAVLVRYERTRRSGHVAVDHLLHPHRAMLRGEPIIVHGAMVQSVDVLAEVYSGLRSWRYPATEPLDAMLARHPEARYLVTAHAASVGLDPRLERVAAARVEGQTQVHGLFRIRPPRRRPALPALPALPGAEAPPEPGRAPS